MASKRMFDLAIVDTDIFLEMPQTTQNLYFHLNMRADDDGFVGNPKKIIKLVGANDDDMKLLILKGFVIPFENGVCVIRHWKINNYIRKDRYKPTIYQDEKKSIIEDKNGIYKLQNDNANLVYHLPTNDMQNSETKNITFPLQNNSSDELVYQRSTDGQPSIEENSINTTNNINIYTIFEREFGRTLSPLEYEQIEKWLEEYGDNLIIEALKEMVLNGVSNLKYLERILIDWKKNGIKTRKQSNEKRTEKVELVDYDWLNEMED